MLKDLVLPPFGKSAALLWLKHDGELKPGREYHVDVLQVVKERLVGGATLILPVAGDPRPATAATIDWGQERESAGQAEARPRKATK